MLFVSLMRMIRRCVTLWKVRRRCRATTSFVNTIQLVLSAVIRRSVGCLTIPFCRASGAVGSWAWCCQRLCHRERLGRVVREIASRVVEKLEAHDHTTARIRRVVHFAQLCIVTKRTLTSTGSAYSSSLWTFHLTNLSYIGRLNV